MSFWKTRAEELIRRGYQPGNQWEKELGRSLKAGRPEFVAELGGELNHYLQVMSSQAMEMFNRMVQQGTPPDVAKEVVREEFLTG
jgi:hypothetical protein